jgi:hypothetical protein
VIKDSQSPTYKHQENQLTAFDFDKDFGFSNSQKELSQNYQQLQQPNYFSFQSSGYGSAQNDDFARRTKPTEEKKKKKQRKNKDKFASYYKTQEQHQEKEEKQQKEQQIQQQDQQIQQLKQQQHQQEQQYSQLQQISHQLMQHSLPQLSSGVPQQYSSNLYHVSQPPKHPESGQTTALGSKLHTSFISKDSSSAASNSHEVMIIPPGSGEYQQQPSGFQINPQSQDFVQEYPQQQQQLLNYVQPLEYQLGAAFNQQMFTMSPMQQEHVQPTQQLSSYGMS